MLLFVILTALQAQISLQKSLSMSPRIIGGGYANVGDFPYQVSLQGPYGHFCGGSIISETFVISAAHCTTEFKKSKVKVVVGAVDLTDGSGQYISVDTFIDHPEYNEKPVYNDISLIKLAKSLSLGTGNVDKIEISNADLDLHETKLAYTTGYGYVSEKKKKMPNYLKYAYVPVWRRADCVRHLKPFGKERMICAGEVNGWGGACQGDSGGPLVLDDKLYGIVSYGFGCGTNYLPTVYTYVPYYRSWIEQYVDL